jgi:hypothetical protein
VHRFIVATLAACFAFAAVAGAAPAQRLTNVVPWEFNPFGGSLVESDWINHIGCPRNAAINTGVPGAYTDPACPTEGPTDRNVQGLLLAKTGPTANIASAGAKLEGVRGIVLQEIGYDIRKHGGVASPFGSHCGAGAPRFNVVTDFGTHFIGCASPPPVSQVLGEAFTRMRWSPATAFPPIPPGAAVQTIDIVFDEGTDVAPAHFGMAILDNISVNGVMIGLRPPRA